MVGMCKDFLYEPRAVTKQGGMDAKITPDSFGIASRSRVAVVADRAMLKWALPDSNLWGYVRTFRTLSYLFQEDFLNERVRRSGIVERVTNKKEIKLNRDLEKKKKQKRWAVKIKKADMNHEEKLLARIERAQKKLVELQQELKKFELPPLPMPKYIPDHLTAEERYLQKIGRKSKNFISIGRRGIFGGVVQNMHLHWKKHRLVKIHCGNLPLEEINAMAQQLARLSGGTVVDIQDGETIIFYRGKKYTRPKDIIPENTLSKRKALLKSKCEHSFKNHERNIQLAEQELKLYRVHMAREAASTLLPKDATAQRDTASFKVNHPDTEIRPELV